MKPKYLFILAVILLVLFLIRELARPCEMLCLARTDLLPTSLWETNDIVCIQKDGWKWGKSELDKNLFFILKCPDLSVDEAKAKYLSPRLDTNKKVVANREYKIDTTKITVEKGVATTDKATLSTQLIKKAVAVAVEP